MLVAASLGLFVLVVLLGLWRALPLPEVLMVAISQMVSMVPEGLPVAMTIALAVGMQRMAGRGAIIRRLSAVETLGSVTVICTDKTGTLTRNEMTVVGLWLPDGREVCVEGIGYRPQGRLRVGESSIDADDTVLAPLLDAAVLCNDAELVAPPPEASEHGGWTVLGDPTEGALRVLAAKAGRDGAALRAAAPRHAELPFDADTQMMATWNGAQVWIKGAPEAVLRLCRPEDEALHARARAQAEAMAARAWRVLAFAVVEDAAPDASGGFAALQGRARLLGLVAQIDPPREEVREAVTQCRRAGSRTVMVTGDHRLTGLAIARDLGIARDGDLAVDGRELERMDAAALQDALGRVAVFARVQPAQKLRIVEALQTRGEVVAMTGDGVNDAPALARADVGVAMGITGPLKCSSTATQPPKAIAKARCPLIKYAPTANINSMAVSVVKPGLNSLVRLSACLLSAIRPVKHNKPAPITQPPKLSASKPQSAPKSVTSGNVRTPPKADAALSRCSPTKSPKPNAMPNC